MTLAQARRLAIAVMKLKLKALAFDKSLYEKYGARTYAPTRAFREYKRIKQAIEVLENEKP